MHKTHFLIDTSLYMHFCEHPEDDSYYVKSVNFLKSLSEFVKKEPCYLNKLKVYRGKVEVPFQNESELVEAIKNLEHDTSISTEESLNFWRSYVRECPESDFIYILTGKPEASVFWAIEELPMSASVTVFDFSRKQKCQKQYIPADCATHVYITDQNFNICVYRLHIQLMAESLTVIHFGCSTVGEIIRPLRTKNRKPCSISMIKIFGSALISTVDGIKVFSKNFLMPIDEQMYGNTAFLLSKNSDWKKMKSINTRQVNKSIKDFVNIKNYTLLRDLMIELNEESEEEVVLIGSAFERESCRNLVVALRSKGLFEENESIDEIIQLEEKDTVFKKEGGINNENGEGKEEYENDHKKVSEDYEVKHFKKLEEENTEKKDDKEEGIEEKKEKEKKGESSEEDDSFIHEEETDDEWEYIEENKLEEVKNTDEVDREQHEGKCNIPDINTDLEEIRADIYIEVVLFDVDWISFKNGAILDESIIPLTENIDLTSFPPIPSYTTGEPVWYYNESMGISVHKMLRALRKLPERTSIFQKEIENMSMMITLAQNKSYAIEFSKILRGEIRYLPRMQQQIAYETARHFDYLAKNIKGEY